MTTTPAAPIQFEDDGTLSPPDVQARAMADVQLNALLAATPDSALGSPLHAALLAERDRRAA